MKRALTSQELAEQYLQAGIKCLKDGNFKAAIMTFKTYFQISIESFLKGK